MRPTREHLDLNGQWLLVLDPEDRGAKDRWYADGDHPEGITVEVPSVWDRWVPDYDGVGWYFRTFTVDEKWLDRHVSVDFEAADYYTEVWLNGQPLGSHEGGYTPFSLPAGAALQAGENLLAVRLVDPHAPQGWGPFRTPTIPCGKEDEHFNFAGLWGGVALTARPRAHIIDVFVQPDLRRERAVIHAETKGGARIRLSVDETNYTTEGAPGKQKLLMPGCTVWSPEAPHLYTLRAELLDEAGSIVDVTSTRFGMREFTVKDNRFHLNGRPYYVRAILHQPEYPRTLAAPADEVMARQELSLAKEAGFNMIRLHARPAPSMTLDIADELGLLIHAEPPLGLMAPSPELESRCLREVEEMIRRDRNHPSIVIWGMLSESGNAGRRPGQGAQMVKETLCARARELDPTRVIIDDVGGAPITRTPAQYMPPFSRELRPFDDTQLPLDGPAANSDAAFGQYCGTPDRLVFPLAQGLGGFEDMDAIVRSYGDGADHFKDARRLKELRDKIAVEFRERALDRTFGSLRSLAESAQQLHQEATEARLDALCINPKVDGYCLGQLAGAGLDVSTGLLDRWRRPKPAYDAVKAAQTPIRLVIRQSRQNLAPREEDDVEVIAVNASGSEMRCDFSLQVIGPTNQVLWKKKRSVKLTKGVRPIWEGAIAASGSTGAHRFVVRLMHGVKIVAEASAMFFVYATPDMAQAEVHVVDPQGQFKRRCQPFARVTKSEAPVYVLPPLANTIRAYPDEAMGQMLSEVEAGAAALIFGPPEDWNDLAAEIAPESLSATSRAVAGAFSGVYHYVRLHPVFEGLPSRCLMGLSYASVTPEKTFTDASEEDIAGVLDLSQPGEGPRWGHDILLRSFGSGHIAFVHLRVLENIETDPLAQRLFVNLVNHFGRLAVPAGGNLPTVTRARNWIRRSRTHEMRRWMVVGMFPNWNDEGRKAIYPPEEEVDFDAVYEGWSKPIRWRCWHSKLQEGHEVDLDRVFSRADGDFPRAEYGVAYAYAEFQTDHRVPARITLATTDSVKMWLNGHALIDEEVHAPRGLTETREAETTLRQGRNTVLVKIMKTPGKASFSLGIASIGRDPLNVVWWR